MLVHIVNFFKCWMPFTICRTFCDVGYVIILLEKKGYKVTRWPLVYWLLYLILWQILLWDQMPILPLEPMGSYVGSIIQHLIGVHRLCFISFILIIIILINSWKFVIVVIVIWFTIHLFYAQQARASHGDMISLEERRQKGMEKARNKKRARKQTVLCIFLHLS